MKNFVIDAATDSRVDAKADEILAEVRSVFGDDIKLDNVSRGLLMGAAFERMRKEDQQQDAEAAWQAASEAIASAEKLRSILESMIKNGDALYSIIKNGDADKMNLFETNKAMLDKISNSFIEVEALLKKKRALESIRNSHPGILSNPVTKAQLEEYRTRFIEDKYLTQGTRTDRGWEKAACIDLPISAKTLRNRMRE